MSGNSTPHAAITNLPDPHLDLWAINHSETVSVVGLMSVVVGEGGGAVTRKSCTPGRRFPL